MASVNPFQDEPQEKSPPGRRGAPPPQLSGREAMRIARQIAADANAGRSSYTMGMLVVMTITCAAILGVCGTTLQDLMTSQETRKGLIESIISGGSTGVVLGAIVAAFVRFSTQTIFLGSMIGGLLGAITTPSALYADESPTAALVAAAIVGPVLILGVSYAFARLSRRPQAVGPTPQPSSPWEPLPTREPAVAEDTAEEVEEPTPISR